MLDEEIRCISSSPSAPARARPELAEDAVSEDAKAAFCVLAMPIEDELRDIFEKAMAAETMAELKALWEEVDKWRLTSPSGC